MVLYRRNPPIRSDSFPALFSGANMLSCTPEHMVCYGHLSRLELGVPVLCFNVAGLSTFLINGLPLKFLVPTWDLQHYKISFFGFYIVFWNDSWKSLSCYKKFIQIVEFLQCIGFYFYC